VRRHAESDNIILLIVLLEVEQVVPLMVVKYKQLVSANNMPFCMHNIGLQPLQAQPVCCPAVSRDRNNLVIR
jgi:hypothetical protein